MRKVTIILLVLMVSICLVSYNSKEPENNVLQYINEQTVQQAIDSLTARYMTASAQRIKTGVTQTARLWLAEDGSAADFVKFCTDNFIADSAGLDIAFEKINRNSEILAGNFNRMSLALQEPLDLDMGEISTLDLMYGSYEPASHLNDDFFKNKITFFIYLNFPAYSLQQQDSLASEWNSKQWAYASMVGENEARIPAPIIQSLSDAYTKAEAYISEYNIYMGRLVNQKNERLFAEDMVLISHWGLRDELKSNYKIEVNGLEKQDLIYDVMKHIILQDIPSDVINSDKLTWNPVSNQCFADGKEQVITPEADVRYQMVIDYFKLYQQLDAYYPTYKTLIDRTYLMDTRIPKDQVEQLFKEVLSSTEIRKTAKLISECLNRPLKPYDIWYNGFRSSNTLTESELDKIIQTKYPDPQAFENDIPSILTKLGFTPGDAAFISSKIVVDPARGSGHATGALIRNDVSHLRTRMQENGMDYKGYNIAIHELGHNVEQTISLFKTDYYMINGVPNTAFTEALAFVFQDKDLTLLGVENPNPEKQYLKTLDVLWSAYEIMGVALVDNAMWEWLYAHPEATAPELKEAVLTIAKEVWNTYYADVFGSRDEIILAIYSHMIAYPLYLHSYPLGHMIQFQLDEYLNGKDFGNEITRIYSQGSITPQAWMLKATGSKLSSGALLKASDEALKFLNQ